MPSYPTDIDYMDGATFSMDIEDVAIEPAETEGGYSISRPRFTRDPRRTWSWRYTNMSPASVTAFENFWKLVKGRSNSFNWTHPITGEIVNVRFGQMKWNVKKIPFLNRFESDTVIVTEI